MPTVLTPRLSLRALTPADEAAFFELASQSQVAKFMRFSACKSREEAGALLEDYLRPGSLAFAVEERETGLFVGVFAFKREEDGREYGLSTFTEPACWNRGYACEALSHMIPYAQKELRAAFLTAYVVEGNIGSRRVLEKNGFQVDKILHFDDLDGGLYVYRLHLN